MSQSQEYFQREIDKWCSGIEIYPALIPKGAIFETVSEIGVIIRKAFDASCVIDLYEVAKKISTATRELISIDELLKVLVKELPNPAKLNEDELYRLAAVLDSTERNNRELLVALNSN